MGWIVSPRSSYWSPDSSVPQNVTIFRDRFFEKVVMVKRGHMGGSEFNVTGVLLRRGNEDTSKVQRKDHTRTQGGDSCLQSRETRAWKGSLPRPCHTLILGFEPPEPRKRNLRWLSHLVCGALVRRPEREAKIWRMRWGLQVLRAGCGAPLLEGGGKTREGCRIRRWGLCTPGSRF